MSGGSSVTGGIANSSLSSLLVSAIMSGDLDVGIQVHFNHAVETTT